MSQLPELIGPAGAAFLMSEPAPHSIKFDHPSGRVIVREGAAYVTVNLLDFYDAENVKAVGWQVIQESFDFLAASRQEILSTELGDSECVLWSKSNNQYDVTCVITIASKWSMNAEGTVGQTVLTPSKQTIKCHDALRFYRMSQCARGLFDAYRNAYLALECLVSEVCMKESNEPEVNWLTRVINGSLLSGVPSGLDATSTVKAIYRDGRNPLFHAKVSDKFYSPHGKEREYVHELLEKLTLLLVSLLQYRLETEVVRRWATLSRAAQDAKTRVTYDFDEVYFEYGIDEVSTVPSIDVIETPRRFGQLWQE